MPTQVLLVEDSRAMRDYVSSILEAEGDFEVHEVGNGFDALRALPRDQFGLIVTDINMPDVSGIELTRFVRQTPRHANTPLIVISTEASEVDRDRAMSAGASAFVAKPFTPEEFMAAIRTAFNSPRPDRQGRSEGGQ
jgi:two-component system chemotaxis response regulator CheY